MPIVIQTPKAKHLIVVVAAAAIGALGLSTYDAHRCRRILEDSIAAQSQARAEQESASKEPQVCRKEASGLDHDVTLGVASTCPNLKGAACLTYNGQTLTVQAWGARCAAGRL